MTREKLQVIEGIAKEVQTRPAVAAKEKTVSALLDEVKRLLTTAELKSGKETIKLFKAARSEPSDLLAAAIGVRALATEKVNTVENGTLMIVNVLEQEVRPLAVIQSRAREGVQLSVMMKLANPVPEGVAPRAVDRRIQLRIMDCAQNIMAAKKESGFSKGITDLVKDSGIIQGYRRSLELIGSLGLDASDDVGEEFQQQYETAAALTKLVSLINL